MGEPEPNIDRFAYLGLVAVGSNEAEATAPWRTRRGILDAARLVVARWKRGDLAEAVRELDAAITKAEGGAP